VSTDAEQPPGHPVLESGPDLEANPLSSEQRARVLSAVRLKLTLTLFVVTVLLVLSAMMFFGVTRIFDWLTPSIRHDLQWKAQRGVVELVQSAQLGMVVSDTDAVRKAAVDYVNDADVVSLIVLDGEGKPLFRHGKPAGELARLQKLRPSKVHDLGLEYAAWSASEIEGVEVGRVALFISKARLAAGFQLRREILITAAVGCLIALALSLLFVTMYIGPILRVTGEAFLRLEKTTEAALAATRLKSQFLANMSHEIRTPMNGIIGVLDLLARTALSPKQQRYAQTIETSARSLLTIIDDVLDFSKLEAGKYTLRPDDFEIRPIAQDVAELLAPKAHSKGIELVQRVDRSVPYSVHGDVDRIKQVLTNLIGNAIKFTDEGHIQLRVSVDQKLADGVVLRFAVQDTGVGIRPADQAKLFGMFSQVDGSLTRRHGGTGLGLAICKRLAEAMGGAVGVDSEVGKGSTFWFTVKLREGDVVPPDDGVRPRTARVLVVTKNEAQRDTMYELVTQWGMRCFIAESAQQACGLIMDSDPYPFDAAVVDGAFDEREEWSRTLFELCTAEGLPLIRTLSTAQMADSRESYGKQLYLAKPVRASELYNGLVSLLDGVPLTQQRRRTRAVASDDSAHANEMRNLSVLVVDDNEINRLVAVDLLTEFGYASDMACNGLEALEKVKTRSYSAILMDCQMPEMDGYEATRRIRALPEPSCRTPIIALTAHAMAGDRDRVLEAGMDDYTAKPVRARALERVLQRWARTPTDSATSQDGEDAQESGEGSASVRPASRRPPAYGARTSSRPPLPVVDVDGAVELDTSIPRSATIVELYLRLVPAMIAEIEGAVAEGDAEQVRQLAHKLKGSCLSLGTMRFAQACHALEQAGAAGVIDAAMCKRLPSLFAAVKPLLEAASKGASPDTRRSSGP
jgi:signal transduction histidine kinase/CheY-like chemotaxis protein/HPt (histidine-containing phosphotransfer) domain-containing protein